MELLRERGFNIRTAKYGLIAEDIAHVGVYMVEKNDSLMKVLDLLDKKNISAVIVEDLDDLKHFYVISHGDIIKFLVQQRNYLDFMGVVAGSRSLMQDVKAKDIMRGPIEIISRETPIDEIIKSMHVSGYKRVIVGNDQGQPIGIVSSRDILAWNSDFFRKGNPILICVMENTSGIILAKKFFRQEFGEDMLELFGGSISAITSITSEVLKKSGNLRVIEKDYYDILLETKNEITAILVVDHQSIDLRKKLQGFIDQFYKKNEKLIKDWIKCAGPINKFRIREFATIFVD
jgi:CBS domain-containing protein